jgi:hypothetical protein
MSMNIVKEKISDEDAVVIKKLNKPVKTTIIDKSLRIDEDEDISSLNTKTSSSSSSRPVSSREEKVAPKKKLLGNSGPNPDGTIDWDKNPDCVDFIIQYHESSGNSNDDEGYLKTGNKCFRQFNKMFSTKAKAVNVSAEDIQKGLVDFYDSESDFKYTKKDAVEEDERIDGLTTQEIAEKNTPVAKAPQIQSEEYYPINRKNISIVEDKKVLLKGNKLEICKILGCKHVCIVARNEGKIEDNGFFHAACSNSENGQILEGCPQLQEFSGKEKIAFEMFKQQFQGDELKAKKFLLLTRTLYK